MGWDFVDSDAVIEEEFGHSIREHFERFGEPSFRDAEHRVLSRLAAGDHLILATGGGAVLRPDNRQVLRQPGNRVVYLRATVEDLLRRLKHDAARPLLQGVDQAKRLRELFAHRDPLYREVADFTVDTGRTSVGLLSSRLAMQLELSGQLLPRPEDKAV